jgi:hypothetical protein
MDLDSAQYTAFIISFGQYKFKVIPFGLKQASGWFQLLMNEVLKPVLGKCAVVYLDDIIIFSSDRKQHACDLQKVIKLISKTCLQIKLRKCKFFHKKLKFLKHKISEEGIRTDSDKIATIKEL